MPTAVLAQTPAGPTAGGRRRWLPSSGALAWFAMAGIALVRAGTVLERDPYWEARAGLENLSGTPLARPDTWSWAPVDGLFYPNSPAWNVLLGVAWRLGAYWGLFVFGFLAVLAFFGLSYVLARKLGAHPLAALVAVLVAFVWAMPLISSRATIGVQTLLVVGFLVVMWWRPRLGRRSVGANALVMGLVGAALGTVGNWVHLSFFMLGPLLAACWGVYWLLSDWPGSWRDRLRDGRRWAATLGGGAGLVLGSLLSPYGVAGTLERSRATAAACATYILEWTSPFDASVNGWPKVLQWPLAGALCLVSAVLLVRFAVCVLRRGDLDDSSAMLLAIGTMAVPLVGAGMVWLRFVGSAEQLLIPVWAVAITWLARRAAEKARSLPADHRFAETSARWTQTRSWRVVLTITWALLAPLVVLLGPVPHAVPVELPALEALPTGCRLFTTQTVADTAILARPDVLVWLDGRSDYFGAQRLADAYTYYFGTAATAAPVGATCVVLSSVGHDAELPAATARMNADPSWTFQGAYDGFDVWTRAA